MDIQRALRPDQPDTSDAEWRDYWWGMPSFEMADARPVRRIVVNFLTEEDFNEFRDKLNAKTTDVARSMWYPPQAQIPRGKFAYKGPKVDSRYPICIPSKGRAACQRTGKILAEMGVSFRFFVEETEADQYREAVGENNVVEMPFHDLGKGSIPARNFIWDWALEHEHKRHWVVDDNISAFARCTLNRRLNCKTGSLFRAMEDFVDRYENVALAGPHDKAFVPDRSPNLTPVLWNSRIYSCILIDSSLKYRWRGRYNEDTDLSLRVLKSGKCTALFRALLMDKMDTVGSKGSTPLPGGNTDNVYNTDDKRRAFAESLKKQHPDVVEVVWKFNRWHHRVDYRPFKGNKPILRADITPSSGANEYGIELVKLK